MNNNIHVHENDARATMCSTRLLLNFLKCEEKFNLYLKNEK